MSYINFQRSALRAMLLVVALLSTTACTSTGGASGNDPFRAINEPSYRFNLAGDKYVYKPLNTGWNHLPDVFTQSMSNVFNNIEDARQFSYNLLQARFSRAMTDITRILINSTVGLYGLFDVASAVGLPRSDESLEDVLGTWGVPAGPYLHIPLLGPRTTRGLFTFLVHLL